MESFYIWIIIFVAIMIFEFVAGALRKRRQEADTSIDSRPAADHSEYAHSSHHSGFEDDDDYDYDDYDESDYDFSGPDHGHFDETGRLSGNAQNYSSSGRQSGHSSDMFPKRNSLNKSKGNKLFS